MQNPNRCKGEPTITRRDGMLIVECPRCGHRFATVDRTVSR